jgi:hypothetical protein
VDLTPDEVARYLFRSVVAWGGRATSSSATAHGSTSTSAATPSTPPPSATRCARSSPTTAPVSGSSRAGEDAQQRLAEEGVAATSTSSRTTPTPRATPTAATRTTSSAGGRVRSRLRHAHALPDQPPDHLWRRQGRADQQGRDLLRQPAGRPHLGGRLVGDDPQSRPIINTRDEPHADAERYRRLHVIVGDSNMSETTTLLKVGSADLVLRMLEERGRPLRDLALENPIRAIREISHDMTGRRTVRLASGARSRRWTCSVRVLEPGQGVRRPRGATDGAVRRSSSSGSAPHAIETDDLAWSRPRSTGSSSGADRAVCRPHGLGPRRPAAGPTRPRLPRHRPRRGCSTCSSVAAGSRVVDRPRGLPAKTWRRRRTTTAAPAARRLRQGRPEHKRAISRSTGSTSSSTTRRSAPSCARTRSPPRTPGSTDLIEAMAERHYRRGN